MKYLPTISEAIQADEDRVLNPSSNLHMQDILVLRLNRRQLLKGGVAVTASTLFGTLSLSGCGGGETAREDNPALLPKLPFTAVAKNKNDVVTLPEGYQVGVLHALGDPMHYGEESWNGQGEESPESYNQRIGDGHDGMYFFGLSESGSWQANRSDRGLLCVNHEYVVAPYVLHPAGRTSGSKRIASEVEKEIYAHGASVVEIKRTNGSEMSMVRGSRYNRRITSATPMDFTGPAKGNALLRTKYSPNGLTTRGTNNNCANGYTPWGTYLTCEENYLNVISRVSLDTTSDDDSGRRSVKEVAALNRYGLTNGRKSPYLWDTPSNDDLFARWNSAATAGAATEDYRNTINTFGWVVEIDPFNPESVPAKRTALGRFNHEGAWPATAISGQPIVIYMGDDARNEYIYKFVSKAKWDPADAGKGMVAGAKYLDEGTLYVARFSSDGSGEWLELTYGKNGLDSSNPLYAFASQGDIVIYARLAADHVGATKMDRPEWGAVNPLNGEVYMTLTNNSNRGVSLATDAANPRTYSDVYAGNKTNKGNVNGHIIRWRENDDGAAATRFQWDIYLFGSEANAELNVNLSGLTEVNDFSSPDGLYFDRRGILWIQTDDSAYTDVTNCMMLAAIPGHVGDGGKATAVGGTQTLKGANASPENIRRFLVGPKECEITGIALTPDQRTMFVNIQHPGEDATPNFTSNTFGSYWPASQVDSQAKKRPRSATIMITRKDGGVIGS